MSIDDRLEQVRRQLLDLTRRNRLLNFKPVGRRSVALCWPEPATLYRWLAVDQRTIDFAARPSGAAPAGSPAPPGAIEEQRRLEVGGLQSEDVEEQAAVGERQGWQAESGEGESRRRYRVQLDLEEEQLHDRLFHLAREAESAQQEQGCDILYVALGLVEWVADDGKPPSRAPLVLVPVELVRRTARDPYRLKPRDDDPRVNPVLVELCRRQFRLTFPELDLAAEDPWEGLWRAAEEQVARLRGWRLYGEAHLGLFSFAKLLMYLDLDPDRWPEDGLRRHELVQVLVGMRSGTAAAPPIEPAALDDRRPHEVYQVLDADSSQQAALVAARSGTSMVIDGPPGTGKSQTITNMIAELLAEGKRVLFVAEKAAALDVVKRRLDGVGLGTFVLELHSRKVSKRQVLDELDRALRTECQPPAAAEATADELERVRNELREFARQLHDPLGRLGISPREAMERCVEHAQAAEAAFHLEGVLEWTAEQLDHCREVLSGLARAMEQAGGWGHPWHGVWVAELPLVERQRLRGRVHDAAGAFERMLAAAAAVAGQLDIAPPATLAHCRRLRDAVVVLGGKVQLRPGVPTSPAWDRLPADARRLIELCRRRAELLKELAAWFHPRAELAPLDWERIGMRRGRQAGSFLRWLNPVWYADGLRLASLVKGPSVWDPRLPRQLVQMARLRQCRADIESLDAEGAALFGPHWRGVESDWQVLQQYAQYAQTLRKLVRQGFLPEEAASRALTPAGRAALVPLAKAYLSALAAWEETWTGLRASLDLLPEEFLAGAAEEVPVERWRVRLRECAASAAAIDDWLLVVRHWQHCAAAGLSPFLDWCRSHGRSVPFSQWPAAFLRQFYRLWLDAACRQRVLLAARTAADLDALSERFRQLDQAWLKTSQARLRAEIDARRPGPERTSSPSSRLGLLQAEIRRRRGLKPLRQLLKLCGDAVQSLKPCFLMSPISVAQFLEPGRLHFDVAIFDEASQVEPADALGAVARAARVILVGDERQLPPTRFFSAYDTSEPSPADADQDAEPAAASMTDLESVLGIGHVCLPAAMLRWHYRSRHESLIEFSNRAFYGGQLRVFPSPSATRDELGLSLRHLPHTTYGRGGSRCNLEEARAVAREVLEHARRRPHFSLGVGAFSLAQQLAIQDEIERLRRLETDPAYEAFFALHPEEPFFVKNLETIQGDERDVILLSVGYGRDAQGRLAQNFGPLNQEGGWRRLNVLVTRARQRCVVFSSLLAEDLKVGPTTPRGVRALRDFLEYAAAGPDARAMQAEHPGAIERHLCNVLRARGWEVAVVPQPAPLDLAVRDPRQPGRYVLGIQCDGRSWASIPTVRDRERLAMEVLHGLGWRVARVWSTAFLKQPRQVLERLEQMLAEAEQGGLSASVGAARLREGTAAEFSPPLESGAGGHGGGDGLVGAAGEQPRTDQQDEGTPSMADGAPAGSKAGRGTHPLAADAELPPGVQAYRAYEGRLRGTRKELLRLPRGNLVSLLEQIAQVEWPIHREELARKVCGLYRTRATGKAKTLIDDALAHAAKRKALKLHGEFVWLPGQSQPPVRWRGGEEAVTDPRLIDPHEVAAAAVLAASIEYGIPADELPTAALRTMGFKRVGGQLAELARSAVALAVSEGRLRADAAGFLVPSEKGR